MHLNSQIYSIHQILRAIGVFIYITRVFELEIALLIFGMFFLFSDRIKLYSFLILVRHCEYLMYRLMKKNCYLYLTIVPVYNGEKTA